MLTEPIIITSIGKKKKPKSQYGLFVLFDFRGYIERATTGNLVVLAISCFTHCLRLLSIFIAERVAMSARIQRSVAVQTEESVGMTKEPSQQPVVVDTIDHQQQMLMPTPAPPVSARVDCRYLGDGCCLVPSARREEMVRLNDAWELAGLHSRQRMAILGRNYIRLYGRHQRLKRKHRRLRRFVRRSRCQSRYIQLQHQVRSLTFSSRHLITAGRNRKKINQRPP